MSNSLHTDLVSLQQILLRFALSLTADHDDALDLLQDTNLKVLENARLFTPGSNFKAWVFSIMKNTFYNLCQRSHHPLSRTDSIESHFDKIVSCPDASMSPHQCCEMKDIKNAIGNLRKEYRTAFLLLTFGYRYKEISRLTDCPETIVKNNIAFARRTLHTTLAAYRV